LQVCAADEQAVIRFVKRHREVVVSGCQLELRDNCPGLSIYHRDVTGVGYVHENSFAPGFQLRRFRVRIQLHVRDLLAAFWINCR
jgi:hypothetical protein